MHILLYMYEILCAHIVITLCLPYIFFSKKNPQKTQYV